MKFQPETNADGTRSPVEKIRVRIINPRSCYHNWKGTVLKAWPRILVVRLDREPKYPHGLSFTMGEVRVLSRRHRSPKNLV